MRSCKGESKPLQRFDVSYIMVLEQTYISYDIMIINEFEFEKEPVFLA